MATIVTINSGDQISNSRTDLNTNFTNLNSDKIETSVLDTDTTMAANSDTKIPSQKAVKTYIDTSGGANASETARGIVEEATDAEVTAGTATGATGAKLFVTPTKLATRLAAVGTNAQLFTADGTWTKPSGLTGNELVVVEAWGGGGSGGTGVGSPASVGGSGGGGGHYAVRHFKVSELGSTEAVGVGASVAGVSSGGLGNAGNNSTFGSFVTAYGGGAGSGTGGAGGGGWTAKGTNGSADGGAGGASVTTVLGAGNAVGGDGGFNIDEGGGGGGDGGATGSGAGGAAKFGGGGGGGANSDGTGSGGNGGASEAGGGGGGGAGGSSSGAAGTGGVSKHGGNGGAGSTTTLVGTAGSAPGGGGGGSFSTTSGAGARGEVRVYVVT